MGRLNCHLWQKPGISCSTKLRIFNSLVDFVMLYGAETWRALVATLKAIDGFQSKSLRRIKGLQWFELVSDEKLLHLTKQSQFSTLSAELTLQRFGQPAEMIFVFDPIKGGWKRPRG